MCWVCVESTYWVGSAKYMKSWNTQTTVLADLNMNLFQFCILQRLVRLISIGSIMRIHKYATCLTLHWLNTVLLYRSRTEYRWRMITGPRNSIHSIVYRLSHFHENIRSVGATIENRRNLLWASLLSLSKTWQLIRRAYENVYCRLTVKELEEDRILKRSITKIYTQHL